MESLHNGAEASEKDDSRKQEGDGAGPEGLVEVRVVVFSEESEDVIDGVWRRRGGSEAAAEEGEGGGEDAVDAEGSESAGEGEEKLAVAGARGEVGV